MRYRDRIEAGQQLAEQLRLYANRPGRAGAGVAAGARTVRAATRF